jgi:hypothetical protein
MLVEGASLLGPYVALSHQWGDAELPKTTLANIQQRRRSISRAALSKTIQDAISIVRELGFRYLWIDVLCIIQDSESDWLNQSATMGDVFRSAVLTLAVADSKDHSEGIFRPRQAQCVRPIRFEDFRMSRRIRSWFDGEGCLYLIPGTQKVAQGVRPRGPLDSRGWILQEQMLSPRILYYGRGELFWECIELSASESCPVSACLLSDDNSAESWAFRLLRKTISASADMAVAESRVQDAWMEFVKNYSARTHTYQSDKFVAIEGILSSMGRIYDDPIVAGMWKRNLWRQLTWWMEAPQSGSNRSPRFTAPSWSWLNTQSSVFYHNTLRFGEGSDFKDLVSSVEIQNVTTETVARDAEIRGTLTVAGETFPHVLTADDFKTPAWRFFHRRGMNKARWWLDEGLKLPTDILCLILAQDATTKMLVCLCLLPVEGESLYKRVGLCHWDGLQHSVPRFTKAELVKQEITIR